MEKDIRSLIEKGLVEEVYDTDKKILVRRLTDEGKKVIGDLYGY